MAWRIHDSVIRGEIDNRQRGQVTGKLWLEGMPEPVQLELNGNAAPDLAGCLLQFENPGSKLPMRSDAPLATLQRGTIGDLTASRKVRVPEMSVTEVYQRKKQGLPVPEHTANCLYLEWFSEANGRVVVESANYNLTISAPAWRLSEQEENERREQSAKGFSGFLQRLSQAVEASLHNPPEDKPWDEFDYEKFMRECDARTEKYGELMDKYRDHPDRDQIVAREMGWTHLEQNLDEERKKSRDPSAPAPEAADSETGPETEDSESENAAEAVPELEPDPATEGVDWVRRADGRVAHPLVVRVSEGSSKFWDELEALPPQQTEDQDLSRLLAEYQTTGIKLAGALDSLAYGRELTEGPFIVACLKRALDHLHAAQAALEKVLARRLLPAARLEQLRKEFFQVREEILRLMNEFRQPR